MGAQVQISPFRSAHKHRHAILDRFAEDQLSQTRVYLKDIKGMPHDKNIVTFALNLAVWAANGVFDCFEKDWAKREQRKRIRFVEDEQLAAEAHKQYQLTKNEELLMRVCREMLAENSDVFAPTSEDPLTFAFQLARWAAVGINQVERNWYERHAPNDNPVHFQWNRWDSLMQSIAQLSPAAALLERNLFNWTTDSTTVPLNKLTRLMYEQHRWAHQKTLDNLFELVTRHRATRDKSDNIALTTNTRKMYEEAQL